MALALALAISCSGPTERDGTKFDFHYIVDLLYVLDGEPFQMTLPWAQKKLSAALAVTHGLGSSPGGL